ncbi:MAG: glutamine synthetase type III [Provencibacterium sp.]|jgi:glutamine synthetase|nr:glutamine synthetase type III [Provencibacterium sp.]
MMDVRKIFGSRVFSDEEQRKRLPPEIYESLRRTREGGSELQPDVARAVAKAMMEWAIERGATHYTHWFQPMTNITAGKQDAFASPGSGMQVINEFSEDALIKGEPDASSFPSGGLRATFEARGYTTWDPTSPAFVKDGALYIPTAFCSYTGEALDQKTPLLRSMQAVSREALRLIRLLGNTTSRVVYPTVGIEQEYFLVDREQYERRLDLKLCGRTLFGAKPPKGQELDDHYCGRIRLRVAAFMKELDRELWSYGVLSKTRHNEAAPAQHEFACIYNTANIACDANQLAMEAARIVAKKHRLACLLHEKPFAGVNGSGKHNNYSLSTDDGLNLLSPGPHPEQNDIFLALLAAFVRSVDKYADLLRLSTACAGNDHRLGACEAPPAILSIFLGGRLTELLEHIAESGRKDFAAGSLMTGVDALPTFQKDDSDRNRTSPFAFTGNKFEFRMLGSSQSAALANTVLNTILADSLHAFSGRLEMAEDRRQELREIVRDTMHDHGRVIFNGNNYAPEWVEEAARRGLPNCTRSLRAFDALEKEKNLELFSRFGVFSPEECRARREVLLENYVNVLQIEAAAMLSMASRQLYPAALRYIGEASSAFCSAGKAGVYLSSGKRHIERLASLLDGMGAAVDALQQDCDRLGALEGYPEKAGHIETHILPDMQRLRAFCDQFEAISDKACYPIPDYIDLIHRI